MGDYATGGRALIDNLNRKTYYEDSNFRVYLEEINNQVVIHVVIYNFSKSIFKDVKRVWAEVLVKMYYLGYEEVFAYTKDNRIIKMIGGAKMVGDAKGYEVWKWELN